MDLAGLPRVIWAARKAECLRPLHVVPLRFPLVTQAVKAAQ